MGFAKPASPGREQISVRKPRGGLPAWRQAGSKKFVFNG